MQRQKTLEKHMYIYIKTIQDQLMCIKPSHCLQVLAIIGRMMGTSQELAAETTLGLGSEGW